MDVITTHINADFDCLGAMIAAKKLYPDAVMVFPGAQERNLREFFVQSAVYAYNFKRIKDVDFTQIRRLILVDVCQPERIGPFAEVAARDDVEIHVYDHHPLDPNLKSDVTVVEAVGATVSIFARIFKERGVRPDADEATLMMLGLYEDTGSLLFNSTTESDYQAAAFLLACGANLNTVADFLTQEMTADQVALLHELLQNHAVLNVNGVDVSVAHASIDHFVGDLAVLAHKLKDMENLDALIVVVRMGDRIFLVGRSRISEVHVGHILAELGGGGHAFASSGTVRDLTLVQVLEKIPEILRKHVFPQWQGRHLMSSPAKVVRSDATIADARRIMTRYSLNALPVLTHNHPVGVITRQTAEKAAHHDLAGEPVVEYMNSDVTTVSPEVTMEKLQAILIDVGQRLVPVVNEGTVVGVITRTDLLRHLVTEGKHVNNGQSSHGQPHVRKKQLLRLMQDQLPVALVGLLRDMGKCADDLGAGAYVVGGFVRDLLLRKRNLDVDVVVEGDGIAFAKEFARSHDCRVRSHQKFGTAVIIFPDGFKVDVASTRMEYYLEPGALPQVEHASIKLDLYRRDFTINTLAVSLNGESFGELLDYYQAQRDLRQNAIRVLHNLSFVEDPTRVFRAIRFEQRLGFHIGRHTEALLRSAVKTGFVDKVAGPRVLNELKIIFREPDPVASVRRMADLGLLGCLHPAIEWGAEMESLFKEAGRAIDWYDLLYTGAPCRSWLVYLLCLMATLSPRQVREFCRNFALSPKDEKLVCNERPLVLKVEQRLLRRYHKGVRPKNSELFRWLQPVSAEALLYMMSRCQVEEVRHWISYYYTQLRHIRPDVDGDDLLSLGVVPGPHFREVLDALQNARLDGRVNSRDDELALVRKRFSDYIA